MPVKLEMNAAVYSLLVRATIMYGMCHAIKAPKHKIEIVAQHRHIQLFEAQRNLSVLLNK